MWALPIRQQLTNTPGNMTVLVRAYSHQTDPALGLRGALRLFGEYFDLAGPWITHHPTEPTGHGATIGTFVLLALWLGAAVVAWRRRHEPRVGTGARAPRRAGGDDRRGAARPPRGSRARCSTTSSPGLPIIPCLVIAAIGWTAWRWFSSRARLDVARVEVDRRHRRWWPWSRSWSWRRVQFAGVEAPGGWLSDSTASLGRRVGGRLDPSGATLVRWDDPVAFGGVGFGLLADLEHQGFDVGADATYRTEVVPHRVMDPSRATRVLYVVTGAGIDRWRTAGVDRVAAFDPRTPAERREAERTASSRSWTALQSGGHAEAAAHLDENYWAVLDDPSIPGR